MKILKFVKKTAAAVLSATVSLCATLNVQNAAAADTASKLISVLPQHSFSSSMINSTTPGSYSDVYNTDTTGVWTVDTLNPDVSWDGTMKITSSTKNDVFGPGFLFKNLGDFYEGTDASGFNRYYRSSDNQTNFRLYSHVFTTRVTVSQNGASSDAYSAIVGAASSEKKKGAPNSQDILVTYLAMTKSGDGTFKIGINNYDYNSDNYIDNDSNSEYISHYTVPEGYDKIECGKFVNVMMVMYSRNYSTGSDVSADYVDYYLDGKFIMTVLYNGTGKRTSQQSSIRFVNKNGTAAEDETITDSTGTTTYSYKTPVVSEYDDMAFTSILETDSQQWSISEVTETDNGIKASFNMPVSSTIKSKLLINGVKIPAQNIEICDDQYSVIISAEQLLAGSFTISLESDYMNFSGTKSSGDEKFTYISEAAYAEILPYEDFEDSDMQSALINKKAEYLENGTLKLEAAGTNMKSVYAEFPDTLKSAIADGATSYKIYISAKSAINPQASATAEIDLIQNTSSHRRMVSHCYSETTGKFGAIYNTSGNSNAWIASLDGAVSGVSSNSDKITADESCGELDWVILIEGIGDTASVQYYCESKYLGECSYDGMDKATGVRFSVQGFVNTTSTGNTIAYFDDLRAYALVKGNIGVSGALDTGKINPDGDISLKYSQPLSENGLSVKINGEAVGADRISLGSDKSVLKISAPKQSYDCGVLNVAVSGARNSFGTKATDFSGEVTVEAPAPSLSVRLIDETLSENVFTAKASIRNYFDSDKDLYVILSEYDKDGTFIGNFSIIPCNAAKGGAQVLVPLSLDIRQANGTLKLMVWSKASLEPLYSCNIDLCEEKKSYFYNLTALNFDDLPLIKCGTDWNGTASSSAAVELSEEKNHENGNGASLRVHSTEPISGIICLNDAFTPQDAGTEKYVEMYVFPTASGTMRFGLKSDSATEGWTDGIPVMELSVTGGQWNRVVFDVTPQFKNNGVRTRITGDIAIECKDAAISEYYIDDIKKGSVQMELPSYFADGAVFQRNEPIPIWGVGNPDAEVTVSLGSNTATATADSSGNWEVTLDAMAPQRGLTLTVADSDGYGRKSISNIAIGDVFLCSGQSNMQLTLRNTSNYQDVTNDSANYDVRFFSQDNSGAFEYQSDVQNGMWITSSPASIGSFSGVGYYFARYLYEYLQSKNDNVAIGLVDMAYGGTFAECWMPEETVRSNASFDFVETVLDQYKSGEKQVQKWNYVPTACYNSMYYPLKKIALKGVLWYQGEGNASTKYLDVYGDMLDTLVDMWRTDTSNPNLPVFIVQLAPYAEGEYFPEIRQIQLETSKRLKNVYCIATENEGPDGLEAEDVGSIHPRNKMPIGYRIFRAAAANIYNDANEWCGPEYESMTISGNTAELTFSHLGSGLKIDDGGDKLTGFEISSDGVNYTTAQAVISDNKVLVSADEIQNPVSVRYCYIPIASGGGADGISATLGGNLSNDTGIPAYPFVGFVTE